MSAAVRPLGPEQILARADRALGAGGDRWRTLDPSRTRASTLHTIGARVLGGQRGPGPVAFAEGLAGVAAAMQEAFPDNLFWDLDFLGRSLWEHGRGEPARLRQHAAALTSLQRVFGRHTVIGFAYVHDFTYGYDWAKWVACDPAARTGVAPASSTFVAVMRARGDALLRVIADGTDPKYPGLAGPGPRNPFGFSRAPQHEALLLTHLAMQGSIPVQAWQHDPPLQPHRSFGRLRRDAAERLGLSL